MLSRIKKNDLVVVVSGKDKGKSGNVISMDHKKNKLMIKNVCIVTRHVKARKQGEKSGIVQEESFISKSKVMPFCSFCKKQCRVRIVISENGKRKRMCHRCEEAF